MSLEQQYDDLCARRDAVNETNAPLEQELARVCAEGEALRIRAAEIAAMIDAHRGGEAWLALKRDIRILAPAMERAKAARAG